MQKQSSENEFQPQKENYLTILGNLLQQNTNHGSIKEKLKKIAQRIEGLTYSALVDPEDKYIQKLGTFVEDQNLFMYIGKLLNNQAAQFLNQHERGTIIIKSNIKPPPEPQPEPSEQLMQEVQNVLSNVDLPLSLFKRNDNYWSINNPKTKEAQVYLKKLHEQDQNFKLEMKKKRDEIIKQKQQIRSKTIEVVKNHEESQKKQLQQKINKKIQDIKKNDLNRKKAISESLDFMKQKGVPLFKKIERQFKQKVQIPSLEQKKRKLSELRQIVRSVPLQQIHSHRQRYEKQKSQRQQKKIINEPVNISFKSHFYEQIKSMSTSRFNEMQSNLSLYQRKLQYSRMVKENHQPAVDELKKEEIQSRIKLMNKRKVRAKKIKKQQKDSDQDSDQEQEEEEQQEEPEPEQDQDYDSDKSKPQKDDQYEPTQKERYKMGINYLKVARRLAAKKDDSSKTTQNQTLTKRINTATQNKTISFGETLDNKEGKQILQLNPKKQKFVWVSKYDQELKKQQRIKYINYLRQMEKGHQSVDLMDTSQIKKQIEKSYDDRSKAKSRIQQNRNNFDINAEIMYHTNLENKLRNIQERAKNQEELLKFKRINRTEKIKKKMAIDEAVVDTIKARLLMMNKTLDI